MIVLTVQEDRSESCTSPRLAELGGQQAGELALDFNPFRTALVDPAKPLSAIQRYLPGIPEVSDSLELKIAGFRLSPTGAEVDIEARVKSLGETLFPVGTLSVLHKETKFKANGQDLWRRTALAYLKKGEAIKIDDAEFRIDDIQESPDALNLGGQVTLGNVTIHADPGAVSFRFQDKRLWVNKNKLRVDTASVCNMAADRLKVDLPFGPFKFKAFTPIVSGGRLRGAAFLVSSTWRGVAEVEVGGAINGGRPEIEFPQGRGKPRNASRKEKKPCSARFSPLS